MRKLYKFHWDCGRMGDLVGVFAAEEAAVRAAVGREVYFGEVLGKHSEIYGDVTEDDFEVLTDDQAFIDQAIAYGLLPTGHNPLDRLRGGDEE